MYNVKSVDVLSCGKSFSSKELQTSRLPVLSVFYQVLLSLLASGNNLLRPLEQRIRGMGLYLNLIKIKQ